jgi:transposase
MAVAVMIGVDPYKGSHTAVVIGAAEELLGQVRVRACVTQTGSCWTGSWSPPKLAARIRLRGSGSTDKNDPDDAPSVAIAAPRSAACAPVRADDHAAVLKVWAKRHRDLSRARNQVVCRMHADMGY